MQVTDKTRGDVINFKDNVLDLERADLEDPVISIAMGIRWLSYKYSAIPKNNDKNLFNIMNSQKMLLKVIKILIGAVEVSL